VADEPVRVHLVRSGGFAGITVQARVDSATLPAEEAKELAALLDRLDLADLSERASYPTRGADRFNYDLTIQRGESRYHVALPENAVPPDLRPLLTWLLRHATPP
jgi:hypothetical protein